MSGVFRQAWTPQVPKALTPVFTGTPLGAPIARDNKVAAARDSYDYRTNQVAEPLNPVFTAAAQTQIVVSPVVRIRDSQEARPNWTQPELAPSFTSMPLGIPIARNNAALSVRDSYEYRAGWTQSELPISVTATVAAAMPVKMALPQYAAVDDWRRPILNELFPFFSDELVVVPPPPLTAAFQRDPAPIQFPTSKALPQSAVASVYVGPSQLPSTAFLRDFTAIQPLQPKIVQGLPPASYVAPASVFRLVDSATWSRLHYSVQNTPSVLLQPAAPAYSGPIALARYLADAPWARQPQTFVQPQQPTTVVLPNVMPMMRVERYYQVEVVPVGMAVFAIPSIARPPCIRRIRFLGLNRKIEFHS